MSYHFSMSPEEVVQVLYKHLLGRDADPHQGWAALIVAANDPTVALKGILESEEYRAKHPPAHRTAELQARRALDRLQRLPRVVDVGAQTLGQGTHIYDALLRFCRVEVTGFDPLQDRLAERLESEGGEGLTLLPYAAGDGSRNAFYINNDDATSSLYPLNLEENSKYVHLDHLRTVRTEELQTVRLDDVISADSQVDLLKLDVQGAELMVLQGANQVLKNTAVVHCEVEFGRIYQNQPLFSEVELFLRGAGFEFIDFGEMCRYTCKSAERDTSRDRLLWADAVFFRKGTSAELKIAQALLAAVVYGKSSLAAQLLDS